MLWTGLSENLFRFRGAKLSFSFLSLALDPGPDKQLTKPVLKVVFGQAQALNLGPGLSIRNYLNLKFLER